MKLQSGRRLSFKRYSANVHFANRWPRAVHFIIGSQTNFMMRSKMRRYKIPTWQLPSKNKRRGR